MTEAARHAARPRRRWWEGPNFPWSTHTEEKWSIGAHWPQVCAAISEQVASEANALRRELKRLVMDGRLSGTDASAVDAFAQSIRSAGVTGQQLVRLAAGGVQPSPELVDLTDLVRDILDERRLSLVRSGASIRLDIRPGDVYVDACVAVEVANAAIDWALGFSNDVCLKITASPDGQRIWLAVRGDRSVPARARSSMRVNDSLRWLLLRQLAAVAHLKVTRSTQDTTEVVSIEFPKTLAGAEGVVAVELLPGADAQSTLSDARVLVMIANKTVREKVMRLLLANGLETSVAQSVETARPLCEATPPRAIVSCHESPPPQFIRNALGLDAPHCAMIQVTLAPPSFQASGFAATEFVRIGRENLEKELIPALLFEWAQQG